MSKLKESSKSSFSQLNEINVDSLTEKKNGLTYLNWAHAVRVLQDNFPDASWDVKRFDGMPFLKTELGYFVEVELTINGKKLSQLHAVFDFRGKTIVKPSATDINSSIQRCLAKVIALHGLGLYIYARDDAPESLEPTTINSGKAIIENILHNTDVKMITEEQYDKICSIALTPEFTDDRVVKALKHYRVKGFREMSYKQAEDFLIKAGK